MRLICTIFYCLLFCALAAQGVVWEIESYLPKNDEVVAIIEDANASLVMIGTAQQRVAKKTDILFWKISPKGQTLARNYIGSTEIEKGNALTATYDGGYVIAGSTSTIHQKEKKGQEGLILKIDKGGEVLWTRNIGGMKDDAFQDIVQTEASNLIAVGNKDKAVYVACIGFSGELLWEKTIDINGQANAVLVDPISQAIWITGEQQEIASKGPFIAQLDKEGELLWKKKIRRKRMDLAAGKDIIKLKTGAYAVTGMATEKTNSKNTYLAQFDAVGNLLAFQTFGAAGIDAANAVVENHKGDLVFTGFSNSHQRGARRYQLMLQVLKKQSNGHFQADEAIYLGKKQHDSGASILQAFDGYYYAAGITRGSNLTFNNAYVLKALNSDTLSTAAYPDLQIKKLQFVDANHNDTLESKERAFISFQLHNTSNTDVFGVTTTTTKIGDSYGRGISYERTIHIGYIPANSYKTVGIPVVANEELRTDLSQFQISVPNSTLQERISIKSKRIPVAELAITDSLFVIAKRRKFGKRQEKITLEVRLENIGELPAENVIMQFSSPYIVEHLGERRFEIGTLPVDSAITMSFDFFVRSYYELDSLDIKVAAWENRTQTQTNTDAESSPKPDLITQNSRKGRSRVLEYFTLKLEAYNEALSFPTPVYLPDFSEKRRGPNPPNFQMDDIAIQWKSPDLSSGEYSDNRIIKDYPLPHFSPKLRVTSIQEALSVSDFNLLINGENALEIGKIDSTQIELRRVNTIGNPYQYLIIYYSVPLEVDDNEFVLEVKDRRSQKVSIKHKPIAPSLHVFAVGIPDKNLSYTAKDAQDFSTLFQSETQKELYKNIHIHTSNTKEETTSYALKGLMEEISYQRHWGGIIEKEDVVVLFISSHGYIDDGNYEFYIVGSEYDDTQSKIRCFSLSFDDVYDELDRITDCQKILFVDACFSAAAAKDEKADMPFDKTLSNALIQQAEDKKGYQMILSCSEDEKSYEDKAWENGAFTEALLEAFELGDQNADALLYINEIYDYVQLRVPELVKKQKGNKAIQTPYMPKLQLEEGFPIYFLKPVLLGSRD